MEAPSTAAVWRGYLRARDSRDRALRSAAAREIAQAADQGGVGRPDALAALLALGEFDAAFVQAERLIPPPAPPQPYGWDDTTAVLFSPAARPLRQDPRFLPLTARLGLLSYWRASGAWPDFCRDPGLPYDCRAEAARLLPPGGE